MRPLNDLRLLRVLLPAFLAGIATFAVIPALASGKLPSAPAEELQRTGVVKSWRLEADGSLYIELDAAGSGAQPAEDDSKLASVVWLRTQPTGDHHPSFSELALEIVLASTRAGTARAPLTATTKVERALSGASLEEALPLLALGSP